MKIFKSFRWLDYVLAIILLGFVFLQVTFEMRLIKTMGELIGLIQSHYQFMTPLTMADIWAVGGRMVLNAAIILASILVVNFLSNYISSSVAMRLRRNIFVKVQSFSKEQIDKFSTASLITRSTNDVSQIQQTIQQILKMATTAPIMAAHAIKEIVASSFELTLSTVIALCIMLTLIVVTFSLIAPKFAILQKKTDRLNLLARENLTGIRVIRAFNTEDEQEEKFAGANEDLTKTVLYVNRVSSFMSPGMTLIMNSMSLIIYWLGATLINNGTLQYYTMVTFSQYSMHVLMSFMLISVIFLTFPRGLVSAKRINEVLSQESNISDGKDEQVKEGEGKIEFRNVSFRYPDAQVDVLTDVSFVAEKGQTVAFIGATGSGKSTLINLIPRFFDVTSGEVLVDGKNVKDYKLEDLNALIGYVPQKSYLFTGSIKNNLSIGDEGITDEQILEAIEIAQASEFVSKLEDGIDHHIERGGTNVSGGQRQRLCIARAIAKNPEIFIFDDSFSALDYKTDKKLRNELMTKTKDKTKIIVAQRIGTILDADKIIVLHDGKVVGMGTHSELMKNCSEYSEIALSQLSEEELKNA